MMLSHFLVGILSGTHSQQDVLKMGYRQKSFNHI